MAYIYVHTKPRTIFKKFITLSLKILFQLKLLILLIDLF